VKYFEGLDETDDMFADGITPWTFGGAFCASKYKGINGSEEAAVRDEFTDSKKNKKNSGLEAVAVFVRYVGPICFYNPCINRRYY